MKCQFVGNANIRNGKIIPCRRNATVRMRLRGMDAILMGKKCVCDSHSQLLLSPEIRAAGREWQIDSHLDYLNQRARKR